MDLDCGCGRNDSTTGAVSWLVSWRQVNHRGLYQSWRKKSTSVYLQVIHKQIIEHLRQEREQGPRVGTKHGTAKGAE